jgi:hypothetical protein
MTFACTENEELFLGKLREVRNSLHYGRERNQKATFPRGNVAFCDSVASRFMV